MTTDWTFSLPGGENTRFVLKEETHRIIGCAFEVSLYHYRAISSQAAKIFYHGWTRMDTDGKAKTRLVVFFRRVAECILTDTRHIFIRAHPCPSVVNLLLSCGSTALGDSWLLRDSFALELSPSLRPLPWARPA